MKKLSVLIAMLLCTAQSHACDVCGGAGGGSYPGILPLYNQHFVGLHYRYQSFTSTHPIVNGEADPAQSQDRFRSITLWGRFYPLKRVQVVASLPYHINDVTENGYNTAMQSIGDAQLIVNYMLVNTADSSSIWKYTLLAGGGVKAPTGKYGFRNSEGIILSNMQPGTGSWDMLANAIYIMRYRQWGITSDVTYRYNTVNREDYRYGNKISAGLNLFWQTERGKFSILPMAGLRYESSARDMSSYTYRIANPYSGGQQLYGSAGINLYYGKAGVAALYSLPVWENYAGGLVESHGRAELQIQYLF